MRAGSNLGGVLLAWGLPAGSTSFHVVAPGPTVVHAPVPGALLLAGFGTGLVEGWRRRHTR